MITFRRVYPLALSVLLAACGPGTHAASSSHPNASINPTALLDGSVTPVKTPTGEPLLAVLESKKASSQHQADTVAIAGLDGFARAKATFPPAIDPVIHISQGGQILSFQVLLPPQGYVVAGRVFYLDGAGKIRSLSPSNAVQEVTTLPTTSAQQLVSFGVSPDGGRILASVVTVPSAPSSAAAFPITYEIYGARAGGSPTLIRRGVDQAASNIAQIPEIIGWDANGPLGTFPSELFPQGGPPGQWHGTVVRLDDAGKPIRGAAISDCIWSDHLLDGTSACLSGTSTGTRVVVRRPDAAEAWSHLNPPHSYSDVTLAPDGKSVAVRRQKGQDLPDRIFEACFLIGASGKEIVLPTGFLAVGWASPSIVVGAKSADTDPGAWPSFAQLSYVEVGRPGVAQDLGFSGVFIGGLGSGR